MKNYLAAVVLSSLLMAWLVIGGSAEIVLGDHFANKDDLLAVIILGLLLTASLTWRWCASRRYQRLGADPDRTVRRGRVVGWSLTGVLFVLAGSIEILLAVSPYHEGPMNMEQLLQEMHQLDDGSAADRVRLQALDFHFERTVQDFGAAKRQLLLGAFIGGLGLAHWGAVGFLLFRRPAVAQANAAPVMVPV